MLMQASDPFAQLSSPAPSAAPAMQHSADPFAHAFGAPGAAAGSTAASSRPAQPSMALSDDLFSMPTQHGAPLGGMQVRCILLQRAPCDSSCRHAHVLAASTVLGPDRMINDRGLLLINSIAVAKNDCKCRSRSSNFWPILICHHRGTWVHQAQETLACLGSSLRHRKALAPCSRVLVALPASSSPSASLLGHPQANLLHG